MKWKLLPHKSDDLKSLNSQSSLIEQLLINRGIIDVEEKEHFFDPKISYFEKDLDIPNIKKAQERINIAIKGNELIIIYGDYDVDGICASAILYKALTTLGAKVLPYIPHREKEGYGLSNIGLQYAKDSGAKLVITVDNGIVAISQAKFAKELDLDLIITDHHLPGNEKPEAFTIVHSTKMCGAAVAWCLIKELVKKDLEKELLQFVAIATICDVIPLIGLGRAFVVEGLKELNKTTNIGLLSLISESGIKLGSISSFEIGYVIGPRLNAIGRLDHAIEALRLLCTKDETKAKKLAKLLCETNTARQQITATALEQAKTLVIKENNIHVLFSKDWAPGIIGLIAGKITEEYFRPTIAISIGEEISKGSARSVEGVNIVEVIRQHADLLVNVGGHPGAAGFSILTKNIELFQKRLEREKIVVDGEKVLLIDAEIDKKLITKKLVEEIKKFEPFGFENPRPVFSTNNVLVSDVRTVGQGKHLKFKADGIDAIAFNKGQLQQNLVNGQQISLAYNLELDTYNGNENFQFKVIDIFLKT